MFAKVSVLLKISRLSSVANKFLAIESGFLFMKAQIAENIHLKGPGHEKDFKSQVRIFFTRYQRG